MILRTPIARFNTVSLKSGPNHRVGPFYAGKGKQFRAERPFIPSTGHALTVRNLTGKYSADALEEFLEKEN